MAQLRAVMDVQRPAQVEEEIARVTQEEQEKVLAAQQACAATIEEWEAKTRSKLPPPRAQTITHPGRKSRDSPAQLGSPQTSPATSPTSAAAPRSNLDEDLPEVLQELASELDDIDTARSI